MNRFRRLTTIVLLITIVYLAVVAAINQRKVTEKEYALQVLDQYIRYYCPKDGVCSHHQALARMQRDWPHIYKLGFSILEENE